MKNGKIIPKYAVGDWANINDDVWVFSKNNKNKIYQISEVYIEDSVNYVDYPENARVRYRLDGKWFNQNEIEVVTKEKNPEYFL